MPVAVIKEPTIPGLSLSDLGLHIIRYVFYYESYIINSKGYIFYEEPELPIWVHDTYYTELQYKAVCTFNDDGKLKCGNPPQVGDIVLDFEHDVIEILNINPIQ